MTGDGDNWPGEDEGAFPSPRGEFAGRGPRRPSMAGRQPVDQAVVWSPAGLHGVEALTARYLHQEFLPHRHDAFLLGIIEQGGHAVWCRGGLTVAGPDTVATMDRGEVHHGGAADDSGWRQRILYVTEATVAEILEDQSDRTVSPASLHFRECFWRDPRTTRAIRRLHSTLAQESNEPLERQTLFEMVVNAVFCRFASAVPRPPNRGAPPRALERAREYLHAHLAEPCPLEDLAGIAGLRRRQLVEAFTRRFSLPPHRYLTQIRIDAARARLSRGLPASEVAALVGFADQSHFIRRFKAIVGVTPGRYQAVG